jgi:hypothetical protein
MGTPLKWRNVLVGVSLLLATSALSVTVQAAPAAAASSVGGNITRSEILQRAENWYQRRGSITYNMDNGSTVWDVGSTRKYRPDCSGFVDMAWHLNADPNTQGLTSSTYTTPISRSSLMPGDALIDTTITEPSGVYPYHAILFGGWNNTAHSSFWYYSFGGTPIEKRFDGVFSGTLAGHPASSYNAYRYKKVVAEGWAAVTTWCDYVVNTSAPEVTGPGLASPSSNTISSGTWVVAGFNGSVFLDNITWKHLSDFRGADGSGGWIRSNYLTKQQTPCWS